MVLRAEMLFSYLIKLDLKPNQTHILFLHIKNMIININGIVLVEYIIANVHFVFHLKINKLISFEKITNIYLIYNARKVDQSV